MAFKKKLCLVIVFFLVPFFGIQECFGKWVVLDLQSCNLSNNSGLMNIQENVQLMQHFEGLGCISGVV